MKYTFLSAVLLAGTVHLQAQLDNPNTMSVMVNDTELNTEPRRISIGRYGYITGNTIGPDKSLRIWMGTWSGEPITEPGTYLIIDTWNEDDAYHNKKSPEYLQYKGIATMKYVEETKSPRMEYHMGQSQNADETLEVVMNDDGYLELSFDKVTLTGTWWKEKTSATVMGGTGRLMDKMQDKAVTKATGYDQDIDPEGWGYKKQKQTDIIVLTKGSVKLKMQ